MIIDKPLTAVNIEGRVFDDESLKVITIPESAGVRVRWCHFLNFGDNTAMTFQHRGSYTGRVLFPWPPKTVVEHCYFRA